MRNILVFFSSLILFSCICNNGDTRVIDFSNEDLQYFRFIDIPSVKCENHNNEILSGNILDIKKSKDYYRLTRCDEIIFYDYSMRLMFENFNVNVLFLKS